VARIPDTDRTLIFNTINQCSNRFTDHELKEIHEAAIKMEEIYKALIARLDNSRL
jgi:hypothetical protein